MFWACPNECWHVWNGWCDEPLPCPVSDCLVTLENMPACYPVYHRWPNKNISIDLVLASSGNKFLCATWNTEHLELTDDLVLLKPLPDLVRALQAAGVIGAKLNGFPFADVYELLRFPVGLWPREPSVVTNANKEAAN